MSSVAVKGRCQIGNLDALPAMSCQLLVTGSTGLQWWKVFSTLPQNLAPAIEKVLISWENLGNSGCNCINLPLLTRGEGFLAEDFSPEGSTWIGSCFGVSPRAPKRRHFVEGSDKVLRFVLSAGVGS